MDERHKLLENFEKSLKFFDDNSIEKMNFLLFLENLLLKRAFGNNTIFTAIFSVSGVGISPFPPGYAPVLIRKTMTEEKTYGSPAFIL